MKLTFPEFMLLQEKKMTAALRLPNGKVLVAQGDERIHAQIYSRAAKMGFLEVEAGFVDETGKFYTRDEVSAILGKRADTHGSREIDV